MKFNCTNDEAERNIKMLQDNLKDGQTLEDVLQDNLLLVSAHRKLVKADKAGNRTKTNLSQMGKLLWFNLYTFHSLSDQKNLILCVYSTKTALLSVVAEDVQEEVAGAGLCDHLEKF